MVQALNHSREARGSKRHKGTCRQEFQRELDALQTRGVKFIAALRQVYTEHGMIVDAGCGSAMVQSATTREIEKAVEELSFQLGINTRCLESATEEIARFCPKTSNAAMAS